jgi:hypothetical protein
LYGPYGYAAWPAYAYPDYDYWSDNPPPYRPDSAYDSGSPGNYPSAPSSNDDSGFNLNGGASVSNSGSDQNGQTPQPEAAPNSLAPEAQPEPSFVSVSQT